MLSSKPDMARPQCRISILLSRNRYRIEYEGGVSTVRQMQTLLCWDGKMEIRGRRICSSRRVLMMNQVKAKHVQADGDY